MPQCFGSKMLCFMCITADFQCDLKETHNTDVYLIH